MSSTVIIEEPLTNTAMSRTAQAVSTRSTDSTHRQTLSGLIRELRASEALIISSMPRGGLQVVQPQRVTEALVKAYGREFHTEDRASWAAIHKGTAVAASAGSAYLRFLADFGYAHAASAPIGNPVFEGYAGVVQVLRTAEQGAFSSADLAQLTELAKNLELPAAVGRNTHKAHTADPTDSVWRKRPTVRQWALGVSGKVTPLDSNFEDLDPQLQEQLIEHARKQVDSLGGEAMVSQRTALPDSEGDYWTFNLVAYAKYPAVAASGAVVFVCLQPDFPEWVGIRSVDFQADPELSRLVPALKFMQQEFRRGPTLGEIAQTVHLSPFHFHRRFSELLGLTPKHFLLECQIHEAKHELLAGNKSLAKIAADCGFAHQSHFTSRFKQTTGLTPTRWRRMARNRASADAGSAD